MRTIREAADDILKELTEEAFILNKQNFFVDIEIEEITKDYAMFIVNTHNYIAVYDPDIPNRVFTEDEEKEMMFRYNLKKKIESKIPPNAVLKIYPKTKEYEIYLK